MRNMYRILSLAAALVILPVSAGKVQADSIYVMGNNYYEVINAKNHLTTVGHSVTSGGTLADYSTYDQVWDLRYNVNLGASDLTAMGSYLQNGGRMYLSGEHSGFDSQRNTSLVNFLNNVGAGPVSIVANSAGSTTQPITSAGQIVNAPNIFSSIQFAAARVAAENSQGFLVTETSSGSGQGSLLGWDFGDIVGKSSARMLVGFDINIFANGQNWTENMATYLGNISPVPTPSNTSLLLAATLCFGGYGWWRRRTKLAA